MSALLVSSEGEVVAEESVSFGSDLTQYQAPQGFVEGPLEGEIFSDPLMWLEALDLCLERMQQKGVRFSSVVGVSGAGQQHGTVYLNQEWENCLKGLNSATSLKEAFTPALSRRLSPIWMDTSTSEECKEVAQALGGDLEVCRRSGSVPIERFSGPQIRKFAKSQPSAYTATHRIHLVSSFFSSVLTGTDAPIDPGDGFGMNLVELRSEDWDEDLLNATATHLHDKLPPIKSSTSIIGRVSPYFSRKYGFSNSASVVIFTGDNPSSLVGMGAEKPGKVVVSLGTSDTFFAAMSEPRTDPIGYGHVFGNPMGGYLSLVCFRNGSLAREKIKDSLGVDWSAFDSRGLEESPPGNNGNGLLPFFGPEISPRIEAARPVRFGSEAFKSNPTKAELIRACLEGQFLNMRIQTEWIGKTPDTILLTGGASASDGIAQTIADIMEAPVDRLKSSGSVAIGGVIRAASACGGDVKILQKELCSPQKNSRTQPRKETSSAYHHLMDTFKANLDAILG
ncbi:MAG: FGGY-family carbohydrate kinase [Verrucomicrobiota bacterium]